MQKEDFLNAIAADPGNSRLRLMFADWLEERGDPLAAEWRKPQHQVDIGLDFTDTIYGDGYYDGYGYGNGDGAGPYDDDGCGYCGRIDGDGTGNGFEFPDNNSEMPETAVVPMQYAFLEIPWLNQNEEEDEPEPAVPNYYDQYIASRRRQARLPTRMHVATSWFYAAMASLGCTLTLVSAFGTGADGAIFTASLLSLSLVTIHIALALFAGSLAWLKKLDLSIALLVGALTWLVATLAVLFIAIFGG